MWAINDIKLGLNAIGESVLKGSVKIGDSSNSLDLLTINSKVDIYGDSNFKGSVTLGKDSNDLLTINSKINFINDIATNVKIDKNLDVGGYIKSGNPFFKYAGTGGDTSFSTGSFIAFSVVKVNIGGGTLSGGKYTVPVSGWYMFFVTLYINSTFLNIHTRFELNSSTDTYGENFLPFVFTAKYHDTSGTLQGGLMRYCPSGASVGVKIPATGSGPGSGIYMGHSTFSGFLLNPS